MCLDKMVTSKDPEKGMQDLAKCKRYLKLAYGERLRIAGFPDGAMWLDVVFADFMEAAGLLQYLQPVKGLEVIMDVNEKSKSNPWATRFE